MSTQLLCLNHYSACITGDLGHQLSLLREASPMKQHQSNLSLKTDHIILISSLNFLSSVYYLVDRTCFEKTSSLKLCVVLKCELFEDFGGGGGKK